nr:ATP-binding cassette domain-containing protein [Mycobacterium tuberculosis]
MASNALHDLDLVVKPGAFIGIVGRVGQGKSSLLSAIAGGLHLKKGEFWLRDDIDKIAFVSQTCWLNERNAHRECDLS